MEEFNFSYLTQKTKVSITNDTILIKSGIIKTEIKKNNILALYISLTNKDFSELILRFINNKGKTKTKKFMFQNGQSEAIAFADYLATNTNCEDLRSLSKKEALKKIKASDSNKVGFFIALAIAIVVPIIIFLPPIMHYFDNGHQTVDISQIISNKDLNTSNVTVKNGMLLDGIWYQTESSRTTTTTNDYFPLVPLNWKESDPIKILVKTDDLSQEETDNLFSQTTFTGVLENKLWESLGSDKIDFLHEKYPNYNLSDDIVVLNIGVTLYALYPIMSIVIIIIIIGVFIFIRKKMTKYGS